MLFRKEESQVARAHAIADHAMKLQEKKGRGAFREAVAVKQKELWKTRMLEASEGAL